MSAPFSPSPQSQFFLAQNVPPKAGAPTPGVAQDATPPAPSSGSSSPSALGYMPMLMLAAVFIPLFLMSSRRQKKEAAARSSLKKGDRVMTNAGLVGELVEMDDRLAKVKIAPGVTVQIVANTVSPFVAPESPGAKDVKDAKAVTDK